MKVDRRVYLCVLVLVLLGLTACSSSGDGTGRDGGSEEAPAGNSSTRNFSGDPAVEATQVYVTCMKSTPDPLGLSIADTYEMPYADVLTWFCEGFSYENIMIALETSEAVEIPAETLLQMLLKKDWEEIWQEIGFIGK